MIAGRNLLVERSVVFRDVTVNGDGFAEARGTARKGDNVMYRDTDKGIRYFVKSGDTRIVSDRPTTKAKAAAMGVDHRSVVRVSAADLRHQLPRLRVSQSRRRSSRCCSAACWRRQHPAAEASAHAVRRVARLLRHCGAVERPVYDAAGERPRRARDHLAAHDGNQPRVAVHRVSEGDVPVSVPVRRVFTTDTTTSDDVRRPDARRRRTVSAAPTNTGAAAIVSCSTARGTRDRAGSRGALWIRRSRTRRCRAASGRYVRYSGNLSTRLLSRSSSEGASERRLLRRGHLDRFSRYQFGLFDDTRMHGVPASACGSTIWRWCAARTRSTCSQLVSVRPVPRSGLGTGRRRPVGAGSRSPALASPSTFGRRTIRFCGPMSVMRGFPQQYQGHRFDCRADSAVETARQMTVIGPSPTVTRGPARALVALEGQRRPAVLPEPRLLLAPVRRLPDGEGARHGHRDDHRSRFDRRMPRVSRSVSRRHDILMGEEVSCRLAGRRHRRASRPSTA